MADKIFISYRRADASADARSIYQWLRGKFGANQLFIDVDTIQKGRDFRTVLDNNLGECKVLLAIIGPNWLAEQNESGERRIDDPADFVRMEIAQALTRDVAVVPVLVGGAQMPASDLLPEDLKALSFRQSANVSHESFHHDMVALEQDIRGFVKQRGSFKWVGILSAVAIAGLGTIFIWPVAKPYLSNLAGQSDLFPKEATFKTIMQDCMRKPKHPDAEGILERFAAKMKGRTYQYGFFQENGKSKINELVWKDIVKIEQVGGELHVSHNWQNGKLRLSPVIQKKRSTRSLLLTELLLFGMWSQDNGYGCMLMSMDLDGSSGKGKGAVGTGTYDADSFIRLAPPSR